MARLARMLLSGLALLATMLPTLALACGVSARSPLFHHARLVAAEAGVTTITFLGHATFVIESPGGTMAATD